MRELNNGDGVLASREQAATALRLLHDRLSGLADGESVWLDFRSVEALTFPWVDECIGGLLDTWVEVAGETHLLNALLDGRDVRQSLDEALRTQHRVMRSGTPGETAELLGADARRLLEVFDAAQTRGRFGIPELRDELGMTGEAINNQVKRLLRGGVVARVPLGHGREFVYWAREELTPTAISSNPALND